MRGKSTKLHLILRPLHGCVRSITFKLQFSNDVGESYESILQNFLLSTWPELFSLYLKRVAKEIVAGYLDFSTILLIYVSTCMIRSRAINKAP